jgi:hypothetical protein
VAAVHTRAEQAAVLLGFSGAITMQYVKQMGV